VNLSVSEDVVILRETIQRFADQHLGDELLTRGTSSAEFARISQELTRLGVWSIAGFGEADGFGPLAAPLVAEELARKNPSVATFLALHLALSAPDLPEDELCGLGRAEPGSSVARLFLPLTPIKHLAVVHDTSYGLAIQRLTADDLEPIEALGLDGLRHGTVAVSLERDDLPLAPNALRDAMLGLAATCVGLGAEAIARALHYSEEREQFGKPLNQFQAIQFKLADMEARNQASRWLLYRAASTGDPDLASLALRDAVDSATLITDEAVQIHGGYGYTREYPVETLFRDARELARESRAWLALHVRGSQR
jgi:alkylation response protein AidB-like acyl-CoA dehydrogenase